MPSIQLLQSGPTYLSHQELPCFYQQMTLLFHSSFQYHNWMIVSNANQLIDPLIPL